MADENSNKRSASTRSKRRVVAKNVCRLRNERGWTQQDLAERARIDRTHLARFESQGVNVSLDVLFRLAEGLEVDTRELLEGIDEVASATDDDAEPPDGPD